MSEQSNNQDRAAPVAQPASRMSAIAKRKADDLVAQGYEVAGYVLEKDGDRSAVLWDAAVRWVTPDERKRLMHVEGSLAAPAPVAASEFEVRDDGERVRVDRWEVGIRRIVALLWGNRHAFEVDEVVEAVRALVPAPNDDDEGLVRAVLAAPAPVALPLPTSQWPVVKEAGRIASAQLDYYREMMAATAPVAWMGTDALGNPNKFRLNEFSGAIPLYTAATAPVAQPLTEGFVQVPVSALMELKADVNTLTCLSLKAERWQKGAKIKATISGLINGITKAPDA